MFNIEKNKTIQPPEQILPDSLYRQKQIIPHHIPVSASTWWNGVKSGRFPQPIKIGPRTTVWRGRDLLPIINGGAQ
jgi:predicted DNA-binding transcriptional regulator AlpA